MKPANDFKSNSICFIRKLSIESFPSKNDDSFHDMFFNLDFSFFPLHSLHGSCTTMKLLLN